MKRCFAISFLAVYILTATECNQLLKFPVMIEHFSEHRELHNNISFFDFLQMHYIGYDYNDKDQDRDNQLPFKSHEDASAVDGQSTPVSSETISFQHAGNANENFRYECRSDFQSSYLSSIWQPPKSC